MLIVNAKTMVCSATIGAAFPPEVYALGASLNDEDKR